MLPITTDGQYTDAFVPIVISVERESEKRISVPVLLCSLDAGHPKPLVLTFLAPLSRKGRRYRTTCSSFQRRESRLSAL